jgi:hypothetical protein
VNTIASHLQLLHSQSQEKVTDSCERCREMALMTANLVNAKYSTNYTEDHSVVLKLIYSLRF